MNQKAELNMAQNKTIATNSSVDAYFDAIENAARREDCKVLVAMMSRVTGHVPCMWGPGIVGFGSYHYRYDSGREGDSCVVGFASRKGDISIYLMAGTPARDALLARLGRHKIGKACLRIRSLADVDFQVLERLVVNSVEEVHRRHDKTLGLASCQDRHT
jgi:hypothetical protein